MRKHNPATTAHAQQIESIVGALLAGHNCGSDGEIVVAHLAALVAFNKAADRIARTEARMDRRFGAGAV